MTKSGNTVCLQLIGAKYSDFKNICLSAEYRPSELIQTVGIRTFNSANVALSAINIGVDGYIRCYPSYYYNNAEQGLTTQPFDDECFGASITWNV